MIGKHVTLSALWLAVGREEGRRRFEYFKGRHGYLGRDAGLSDEEMLYRHTYSAIAEICVAKFTGWPWKSSVGVFDRADVGECIEVRCRPLERGWLDCGVRAKDVNEKPTWPFVLVHRHEENDNEIKGWVLAQDAPALGEWNETIEGWYVRPNQLCDLDSLRRDWGNYDHRSGHHHHVAAL